MSRNPLVDTEQVEPWTSMRLTNRAEGRTLIVKYDLVDADLIDRYTWYTMRDGEQWSAATTHDVAGERLFIYMHQLILGPPPKGADGLRDGRIDHINGNGLDNRRHNLRYATQSQILARRRPSGGRSRFKGVSWDTGPEKWVARFRGKNLGRFQHEEDAARAFDDAAWTHWGPGCYLNFPDEVEGWDWTPPATQEAEEQ